MRFYTLTAYLGLVEVGATTVREDATIDRLIECANAEWGEDNWDRFEISAYRTGAN